MLYVPVVFLLCCTFTSLVQSAMGCMTAVQAYGFFGTIPATATTAAVSVAATKGLQLVFAVLLMVLGLIVAVNCLKEFFGKEAGSMPDEEPEWSDMARPSTVAPLPPRLLPTPRPSRPSRSDGLNLSSI